MFVQVPRAAMVGSVTDPTGAAVPGATATATNTETNQSRSAVTNRLGQFSITLLPVGTYNVEFDASGFKKFDQTGIVLEVNRTAKLNAILQIGNISEAITVSGDVAAITTTESSVGRTVNNTEIINLPLVNRDVYSLLRLTPGVELSDDTSNSFGYPEQRTMINGGADGGAG